MAGAPGGAVSTEMRQAYGDDDGVGYRGWGPTSSNSRRPGWMPGAVPEAAAAGAGAYYGHQRGNSGGGYEPYPSQGGDDYYYPEESAEHEGGPPPVVPPKSYDRYDTGGSYVGGPSAEYNQGDAPGVGVADGDLQRRPSNASSRYSTVSTDEQAGRSYQNSPRFPQSQGFPNQPAETGGRIGRSTMGAGRGYEDDDQGGRYDAVNF